MFFATSKDNSYFFACFQLDGYNLIRADHPFNTTRGGACIYYKNVLGIKVLDVPSINGCLFCEISVQNRGYVSVLYRSSGQIMMNLMSFSTVLEIY